MITIVDGSRIEITAGGPMGPSGSSDELGYAECLIDINAPPGPPIPIPNVVDTVMVGLRPIVIDWGGILYHTDDQAIVQAFLREDGIDIDTNEVSASGAPGLGKTTGHVRRTPSPGAHLYQVWLYNYSGIGGAHAQGQPTIPWSMHIQEV